MFLKKLNQWFKPKVCGELYAQLLDEYQEQEMEFRRQKLRVNAAVERNALIAEQIREWCSRYQRLKITMTATMTEVPTFEDYALDMEEKNDEIRRLTSMVHELEFKNNELEQKLVKNNFKAKPPEWYDKGLRRAV